MNKPGTSKQPSCDQENVPYSPKKDKVELVRLFAEKQVKEAESDLRLKFHQSSKNIRQSFVGNPDVYNNIHILNYENGLLNEALKRQHEIHLIDKERAKIEKRVAKNMKK